MNRIEILELLASVPDVEIVRLGPNELEPMPPRPPAPAPPPMNKAKPRRNSKQWRKERGGII